MYSFTVCLWIKSNASPGVGTPFSYAVPGQANELVLIESGNNPMEILINDKVSQAAAGGTLERVWNVLEQSAVTGGWNTSGRMSQSSLS